MPLLDLFWSMLWFFLWIAWFWLVIMVIFDIFRSDDLSGWGKALWAVFIIVLPWLGILVYLIARGDSMGQRRMEEAAARERAARQYIQSVATYGGPSTADELTKLADLKNSGVITEDEFNAQKARLLAGS
ncbi:MAG: SHOCT domain-containing protein [Acidimicrobiales bacterium]